MKFINSLTQEVIVEIRSIYLMIANQSYLTDIFPQNQLVSSLQCKRILSKVT